MMVNCFPLALKGDTREWWNSLPEHSITSWQNLKMRFIRAFRGSRRAKKALDCERQADYQEEPAEEQDPGREIGRAHV